MKKHPYGIIDPYKGREYPVPSPVGEYLSACYLSWKAKEDEVTHYYG